MFFLFISSFLFSLSHWPILFIFWISCFILLSRVTGSDPWHIKPLFGSADIGLFTKASPPVYPMIAVSSCSWPQWLSCAAAPACPWAQDWPHKLHIFSGNGKSETQWLPSASYTPSAFNPIARHRHISTRHARLQPCQGPRPTDLPLFHRHGKKGQCWGWITSHTPCPRPV